MAIASRIALIFFISPSSCRETTLITNGRGDAPTGRFAVHEFSRFVHSQMLKPAATLLVAGCDGNALRLSNLAGYNATQTPALGSLSRPSAAALISRPAIVVRAVRPYEGETC